ncbi:ABC transporter ATP-binding protein [Rhodococcus chondri]|uniref:ABC transporter ATP-binding protein n=1 Tax=Rhodococcus chondri TaxID=3065941 RepID=A0ABU7JYG3_9NOCA|nr:ABC transporter ATP-binding protein [Rhodococcus sp. CC-R104]MEE2035053.1 ABC transporter ATP-binding protein [Rhodococcus sp. CC-R104]
MSNEIVVTDRITKRYGSQTVVDSVDLHVRGGEVYGFLGPNGAGKTTTLRMLVGLVRPTTGSARVFGRPPGDPAAAARTGVLIESPGFYPYLSGRENLRVLARYRGLGERDVDDALHRVGLAERAADRYRTYSLGMKQRLGVGAALLGEPELLILDEPTNGLDPAGMAEMRVLVVALADHGHAVLLSSHMLAEVQQVCDRVGVISHGRLVTESTVTELRGDSRLLLRAEPRDRAYATVAEFVEPAAIGRDGDGLVVDIAAGRTPVLVQRLVDAGVDVYELTRRERTLEEVFFQMTADVFESEELS